ncbi:MAG: rhodanese-like domain-containing protein [Chloroflexi bacterium]|nr:MAG: rhodanese-like domain-containing protein [Chloroflexota bacterium]
MSKKLIAVFSILVILSLALTGAGLAAEDVSMAADAYFSGGTQNIKAADLFDTLNDGDESNDPYIIDLRKPEDFEMGHIPGAVNIGVKALFTADKLASLPTDKPIVTYCYTGQTSSQATSALNMLGYQAKSMLFGFPAWANVDGVSVPPFNAQVDQHDYKISDEMTEATELYDPATPLGETVAAAAEGYFSNGTKNIKASAVFDNLNDGDTTNDPFIIDVRKAEDYAAGHIPGAVNMNAKTMFAAENLAKIPTGQPIVVTCYTGQTASQVVSALNMLGYDATNLKFGFASWSPTGKYPFDAATASGNYRYDGAGAMATEAAPAAEAAPAMEAPAAQEAAPATLPATGGVPFDFTWVYFLLGGGLAGAGLYLRRK